MRLLVDTAVFLYLAADPQALPSSVCEAVNNSEVAYLSVASAWEIAIKASIGKITLPVHAGIYVETRAASLGLEILPVALRHVAAVESLPWHHRDPFDRLLVAQAAIEGATIATTDHIFSRYNVQVLRGRRSR